LCVTEDPPTQVLPEAVVPKFTVRSTLPTAPPDGLAIIKPGEFKLGDLPRPLLKLTTGSLAPVGHEPGGTVNAPCGLLIMMFAPASVVQLSSALVTNTVPFQYCVSSGTGSRTSCEPFAFRMASRPKRILLLPTRTRSLLSAGTLVSRLRSAARSVTPSVSAGRTPSRNDSNGPSGATRLTARVPSGTSSGTWVAGSGSFTVDLAVSRVALEVPDGTLAVSAVAANGGVASARSTAPKPKFAYTVPSSLAKPLAVV